MDANDLKLEIDIVTKKAEEVDIPLIRANLFLDPVPIVLWAEQVDRWNKFFDFAKRHEVEFATINTTSGSGDQAEELQQVSVGFIGNGIGHLLILEADKPQEEDEDDKGSYTIHTSLSERHEIPEEVLTELTDTTESDLAHEILEYFISRFGLLEDSYQRWNRSINIFLEEKGIGTMYLLPPMLRFKLEAAKELAREKFEEERFNKERELIPQIVDECIEWSKEKGLTRLIKANLGYFLLEKSYKLSDSTVNIVYNEVNIKLKSR